MVAKRRTDTRLNSDQSGARADRHMQDRNVTQDRALSDDERVAEFRQQYFQSALPDIPKIDGYHVCWLTTENSRDPIHSRIRLGYEPIKTHDIPGWEHASIKTGEWAGCIGVNEMVAFKIPLELYEQYMYINHHEQPLSEEEKLSSQIRAMEQEMNAAAKRGTISLELEDGTAALGVAPEPPSFASQIGEGRDEY
jgi:hypothetical protein